MAKGIQQVQTKKQRGSWYVQGMGRTPKGQMFLLEEIRLEAESPEDPDFKRQQDAAVAKILS